MQTINKHMGEGFAKGENYAAHAYDESDSFGGLAIKQQRYNPASGATAITIGDSTTAITLATYAQKVINIYTTCASVDGSNTVLPVYINATMTGAGGVGRAFEARLEVNNVALGGWSNAIKGLIDFNTSGSVAGLGSAICAEMVMCGATMAGSGTYSVMELELVCPASWAGTNQVSFIYAQAVNAAGSTTKANFVTYGYLFNLVGLGTPVDDTPAIWHLSKDTAPTHALRCLIDGVAYDILMQASQYSSN